MTDPTFADLAHHYRRERALDQYRQHEVHTFVQYDGCPGLPEHDATHPDETGDTIMTGHVEELSPRYPVRVLIDPDTPWPSAAALLRKIAESIEQHGYPERDPNGKGIVDANVP